MNSLIIATSKIDKTCLRHLKKIRVKGNLKIKKNVEKFSEIQFRKENILEFEREVIKIKIICK